MINLMGPSVAEMPQGYFKIIIWGQAEGHMMDWDGMNHHFIVAAFQPRFGFETWEEAKAWWESQDFEYMEAEEIRSNYATGSFMGDHATGIGQARYPVLVNDIGSNIKAPPSLWGEPAAVPCS